MLKKTKLELRNSLKYCKTSSLLRKEEVLDRWIMNHDRKKNSWFWTDNGRLSDRLWKASQYTFYEELLIGKTTICYDSRCSMSRMHVYWNDGLWIKGDDSINVNFADIDFLSEAIGEILRTRRSVAK